MRPHSEPAHHEVHLPHSNDLLLLRRVRLGPGQPHRVSGPWRHPRVQHELHLAASPSCKLSIKFAFSTVVKIPNHRQQNSIEGSIEVGIAIGLLGCPVSQEPTCPSPEGQLGTILFTGQFNPTIHPMAMFYENFTLTVPSADFFSGPGRGQLAVARLHLIGVSVELVSIFGGANCFDCSQAGPSPILELNNITVNLSN
jgi:hypothetical protein